MVTWSLCPRTPVYNEVTFNEKSAMTEENIYTKYFPFTYKYVVLNEKPPIMKENLHIFFFIIGRVECSYNDYHTWELADVSCVVVYPR